MDLVGALRVRRASTTTWAPGGWLVVLSLAVVAASVLALAVARAGDRRAALYFAHLRGRAGGRVVHVRDRRRLRLLVVPDGDRPQPGADRIGHRPHLHRHRRGRHRAGPDGARARPVSPRRARRRVSHSRSSQASSSWRPRCSSPRVATASRSARVAGSARAASTSAMLRLHPRDLALEASHLPLAARARRAALAAAPRPPLRSRPRGSERAGGGRGRRAGLVLGARLEEVGVAAEAQHRAAVLEGERVGGDRVDQRPIVGDHQHGAVVGLERGSPAPRGSRCRGGWWARRAPAGCPRGRSAPPATAGAARRPRGARRGSRPPPRRTGNRRAACAPATGVRSLSASTVSTTVREPSSSSPCCEK